MSAEHPRQRGSQLPDFFATVAADVLAYCQSTQGIWVDLGSGKGGLGLELASRSASTLILVDPNANALSDGLHAARERGLAQRVVAVIGSAESIPLVTESVDLIVSRGSIYFWQDQPRALGEVYRILRPGGKAMIGGGVGAGYPELARREFYARRLAGEERGGPDALREFLRLRSPETLEGWARAAGIHEFEVRSETESPVNGARLRLGFWLRFAKQVVESDPADGLGRTRPE